MTRRPQALVISSSFPPFNESSTIQLVERLQGVAAAGLQIVGVRPKIYDGNEASLHNRLPPETTILETEATSYDQTIVRLRRLPLGKRCAWLYANIAGRVAVPDSRVGWHRAVVKRCNKEIAAGRLQPSLIVSSSGSYTAHIAAAVLARQHGVRWVADLGDPWSICEDGSGFIRRRLNERLELASLSSASGVIFSTEATLRAYQRWLGPRLGRAIAIPSYGFNLADFPAPPLREPGALANLTLSHIGAAHKGNRDLRPLISAVHALRSTNPEASRLSVEIVGPHSQAFETLAEQLGLRNVRFGQRVSFEESLKLLSAADVLVIVGNKSALQIPGKVYPYIGSRKPILYISQIPAGQDPAFMLLGSFPGVLRADNNAESLARVVDYIINNAERLKLDALCRSQLPSFGALESERVNRQVADFIRQVMNP